MFSFIFISLLFNVARNTFGRILTLLVSLGTGIIQFKGGAKQKAVLILLSVLYFFSNLAYLIVLHIQRNSGKLLPFTLILSVSIALSITNTLFFMWILEALKKTKKTLSDK
jgi:hypothetical protein